jgi:hypothetical protein
MQQMVETECQRWASKGINITYQIRENMTGYKASALKEGLKLQQWTQRKKKKKNQVKMKRSGVGWRNPRFGLLLKRRE